MASRSPYRSKPLIAIVDDDADICSMVELWLTNKGFDARTFANSRDFQTFIASTSERVDCAVFDWTMPEQSGLELLKWYRKQPAGHAPVLFQTSRASDEDIIEALEAGADEYVVKPVREGELIARIGALIRRANPERRRATAISPALTKQSLADYVRNLARFDMLGSVVEQLPIAVVLTDPEGVVVSTNHAAASIFGNDYLNENISAGRESRVLQPIATSQPKSLPTFPLQTAHREKEFPETTFKYVNADGSTRFVIASARVILDHSGEMLGVAAIYVDHTETRTALDLQHEQSKILEVVLDVAPLEWRHVDKDQNIIYQTEGLNRWVNELELPGEKLSQTSIQLRSPNDETILAHTDRPLVRALNGEKVSAVFSSVAPDSTRRMINIAASPLLDQDEEVVGAVSIFTDVTDEKRTEAVNSLLENVVNTPSSSIIALDDDKRVVFANEAARSLLNLGELECPFEFPKSIFFDSIDENGNLTGFEGNPIDLILSGEKSPSSHFSLEVDEDDTVRYLRIKGNMAEHEIGHVRAIVVVDDVTDDIIHRLDMSRANRLDALGQLTGGIAHDFNNFLSIIVGAIQLAELSGVSDDAQKQLDAAHSALKRAERLTRRLLSFASQRTSQSGSVHVGRLVNAVLELAKVSGDTEISINCDGVDQDVYVHCDRVQLENALLNLLLNARDAMSQSERTGRIVIEAKRFSQHQDRSPADAHALPSSIEISVRDNGHGMTPSTLSRAVDPFFTTKDGSHGTGLGLSMVYAFVQQAGGEFDIQSQANKGTAVIFRLPEHTGSGENEQKLPDIVRTAGHGERILVTEDEPELAKTLFNMLEALNYVPVAASDGARALAILREQGAVDALLTDVVMPGVDGFELARTVRESHPDLPVVYMSGFANVGENDRLAEGSLLIEKPVTLESVAGALSTVLQT